MEKKIDRILTNISLLCALFGFICTCIEAKNNNIILLLK
jgi:hypothetical protein